jgi:hypothetical protein
MQTWERRKGSRKLFIVQIGLDAFFFFFLFNISLFSIRFVPFSFLFLSLTERSQHLEIF